MSDEEFDEKFYSQIIYRNKNEQEIHEIINKKNRSKSPRYLPKWSPEISYEQRMRRKKDREDVYVQKIYPEERPILLVKKKQVYKNLGNPVLIGRAPDEDPSFKLTTNTQRLDDLDTDIVNNEKNIRRFTMVKDQQKGNETNPQNKSVYKFQGVEYLPEGFLELDPLLYKNEFYFDSQYQERVFNEEQRRLKALRRKQYADKNYLKKRDVTIYVIDQYKDKVVDFLDLWFEKYERKMNKAELTEVATRLGTSYQNMKYLQELYMQKKSILQSTQLKDYFNRIQKNFIPVPNGTRMPEAVRRYLRNLKEGKMTKSKVAQDPLGNFRWKYNPRYLDKYQTTQNISGRPYSATFKSTGVLNKRSKSPYRNKLTSTTGKDYKFGKTYEPKFIKTAGININTKKTKKGFKKKASDGDNSNTDTFFLLSRTNIHDKNMSSPTSKGDKSGQGRMDKLMDEFSELIGKKEAEPIARFHRKNDGLSKTYGNILDDNVNLRLVDGNIEDVYGLKLPNRSYTEKKVPYMDDNNMRVSESAKYDKNMIEDRLRNAQTRSGNPDMSTNDTHMKKPEKKEGGDELKQYFDTEINQILDKIKGIKTEKDEDPYREKINSPPVEENEMSEIGLLKEEMMSGKASNDDLKEYDELSVVDYDESNSNNASFSEEERKYITTPNTNNISKSLLETETKPIRLDILNEYLHKKPKGQIVLTTQQRDKLIQILKSFQNEDEDIILTVNKEQTKDLIINNLYNDICIANINENNVNENNVQLYPKDFYPLIERSQLASCQLMTYPKKMFELVDRRPLMLRKPVLENGNYNVKLYEKPLLSIIDKGFEEGELIGYPQELLDLLQLLGKYPNDINLKNKAEEYFPEELNDIIIEQIEREKYPNKNLFPEEIFELGDQEKITGERLSFWMNDILKLMNRESHNCEKVLYSKDLSKKIYFKYKHLIALDNNQKKQIINFLTQEGNSQVVISPNQKDDLLNLLQDNKNKENMGNPTECVIRLAPDQILDIFNQKCLVKGIPIELNEEQLACLNKRRIKIMKRFEGTDYYDPIEDKIVDYKGDCIYLPDLSIDQRKNLLKKLEGKKFHVVNFEPKKNPEVIEECYFDPKLDAIVDTRKMEKIIIKNLSLSDKKSEIKNLKEKNLKPLLNVMPGEAYYDALTDEIMDQKGDRHALKDMTLNEVEDLVTQNEAEEVPVIIQPGENQAYCLDGVWYLPIEDSLIDHKGRKTVLTDLNGNERLSLMDALGQRKGVPLIKKENKSNIKSNSGSPKHKMKDLDEVMDRLEGKTISSKPWKKNYSGRSSIKSGDKSLTNKLRSSIDEDSKKKSSKKSNKKVASKKSNKKKKKKKNVENEFEPNEEIDKKKISEDAGLNDMGTFVDDGSLMDGTFEGGNPKDDQEDNNITDENLLGDVMEEDDEGVESVGKNTDPKTDSRVDEHLIDHLISKEGNFADYETFNAVNGSKVKSDIISNNIENIDEDQNEEDKNISDENIKNDQSKDGFELINEDNNINEDDDKNEYMSNENDNIDENMSNENDIIDEHISNKDDNINEHISNENDIIDEQISNDIIDDTINNTKNDIHNNTNDSINNTTDNYIDNTLNKDEIPIDKENLDETYQQGSDEDYKQYENNRNQDFNNNFEDFENEFNKNKIKKVQISKSGRVVGEINTDLKNKIEKIFFEEKQKLSNEIIEKCEKMIKTRSNFYCNEPTEDGMLEEFFKFCQDKLPSDPVYKESMMLVSLFYYYLDKKGMLKEPVIKRY